MLELCLQRMFACTSTAGPALTRSYANNLTLLPRRSDQCLLPQEIFGIQNVLWNANSTDTSSSSLTYNGFANPYEDSRAPDIIVQAYAGAGDPSRLCTRWRRDHG